ncbi:hypothetical protein HanRHA438_Chr17g0827331 [Helianthus annuus]|nr:hypothetical protein HanRHA438_Chr17g0827331 [Helianthus annuus]
MTSSMAYKQRSDLRLTRGRFGAPESLLEAFSFFVGTVVGMMAIQWWGWWWCGGDDGGVVVMTMEVVWWCSGCS